MKNEMELFTEKMMTTKEVAESLKLSVESVQKAVRKLAENNTRVLGNIKKNNQGGYLFNETQVTAIKMELQNHAKVNALSPKTLLEKQLLIKQAMAMQDEIISDLQNVVEQQKNQIAELTPMADGYKLTMLADGTYSMAEVAKILKLGYGNRTLFAKLRSFGLLDKNNVPLQEYVNRRYFVVVTTPIPIGDTIVNKTVTRTTAKGVDYIAKKLGLIVDYKTS